MYKKKLIIKTKLYNILIFKKTLNNKDVLFYCLVCILGIIITMFFIKHSKYEYIITKIK